MSKIIFVLDHDLYYPNSKMSDLLVERGGPGSGHHEHAGRPGEVGGSLPDDGRPRREIGLTFEDWRRQPFDEELAALYADAIEEEYGLTPADHITQSSWIAPDGRMLARGGVHEETSEHALAMVDKIDVDDFTITETQVIQSGLIRHTFWAYGQDMFVISSPDSLTNDQKDSIRTIMDTRVNERSSVKIPSGRDTELVGAQFFVVEDVPPSIDPISRPLNQVSGRDIMNLLRLNKNEWRTSQINKGLVVSTAPRVLQSGELITETRPIERGGPGSGHHGHKGRPGEVGGSLPSGETFPLAGDVVSGMKVSFDYVPNTDSIAASLLDYEILPGVREVPFDAFGPRPEKFEFYSKSERVRTEELAILLNESQQIVPLIVVLEEEGPYILEGAHRFDALDMIGKETFPALVVIDRESIVERGGPGSGHRDHRGRRGKVGGSLPGSGAPAKKDGGIPSYRREFDSSLYTPTSTEDVTKVGNPVPGSPPEVLVIAEPGEPVTFKGWWTAGVIPGMFAGTAQRGAGRYIALDEPFNLGPQTILHEAIVDIPLNTILDPNGVIDGTDVEASREVWGFGIDYANELGWKGIEELDVDREYVLPKIWSTMGYRAIAGWIEPGMPMYGRELVIWDKGTVRARPLDAEETEAAIAEGKRYRDRIINRGGPGSGHRGHAGRPGEVGGSLPRGATGSLFTEHELATIPKVRELIESDQDILTDEQVALWDPETYNRFSFSPDFPRETELAKEVVRRFYQRTGIAPEGIHFTDMWDIYVPEMLDAQGETILSPNEDEFIRQWAQQERERLGGAYLPTKDIVFVNTDKSSLDTDEGEETLWHEIAHAVERDFKLSKNEVVEPGNYYFSRMVFEYGYEGDDVDAEYVADLITAHVRGPVLVDDDGEIGEKYVFGRGDNQIIFSERDDTNRKTIIKNLLMWSVPYMEQDMMEEIVVERAGGGRTKFVMRPEGWVEGLWVDDDLLVEKGGPGSGHRGHAGRPGEVGGSLPANISNPLAKAGMDALRSWEGAQRTGRGIAEEGALILNDGTVIPADENGSNSVDFHPSTVVNAKKAGLVVMTHTHPSDLPFSVGDVVETIWDDIKEVRAVTSATIYRMGFVPDAPFERKSRLAEQARDFLDFNSERVRRAAASIAENTAAPSGIAGNQQQIMDRAIRQVYGQFWRNMSARYPDVIEYYVEEERE